LAILRRAEALARSVARNGDAAIAPDAGTYQILVLTRALSIARRGRLLGAIFEAIEERVDIEEVTTSRQ
jgi:hypothetical protein